MKKITLSSVCIILVSSVVFAVWFYTEILGLLGAYSPAWFLIKQGLSPLIAFLISLVLIPMLFEITLSRIVSAVKRRVRLK